uniref:Uncharacterized protein n=1 Tax=Lobelia heterophylla subsp. heterophylla TaxID=2041129 RepID=A0A291EYG5_9ASTR|nr:hypothetical protein Lo_he_he1Pt0587 [Lobelia heterophylla subsp. heterophylla]
MRNFLVTRIIVLLGRLLKILKFFFRILTQDLLRLFRRLLKIVKMYLVPKLSSFFSTLKKESYLILYDFCEKEKRFRESKIGKAIYEIGQPILFLLIMVQIYNLIWFNMMKICSWVFERFFKLKWWKPLLGHIQNILMLKTPFVDFVDQYPLALRLIFEIGRTIIELLALARFLEFSREPLKRLYHLCFRRKRPLIKLDSPETDEEPEPLKILESPETDEEPEPLKILESPETDEEPEPLKILESPETDEEPEPLKILESPETDEEPEPIYSLRPSITTRRIGNKVIMRIANYRLATYKNGRIEAELFNYRDYDIKDRKVVDSIDTDLTIVDKSEEREESKPTCADTNQKQPPKRKRNPRAKKKPQNGAKAEADTNQKQRPKRKRNPRAKKKPQD